MWNSIRLFLLMILLFCGVFAIDLHYPLYDISQLYIVIIFLSLWSKNDKMLFLSHGLTIVFTIISYYLSFDDFELEHTLPRISTLILTFVFTTLILKRKEDEKEMIRANKTLELRVLARTAASESRSRELEKQIKILQIIREKETNKALNELDSVIENLKELSKDDTDEV